MLGGGVTGRGVHELATLEQSVNFARSLLTIIADLIHFTSMKHICHGDYAILHISTVILSGWLSLYGNRK